MLPAKQFVTTAIPRILHKKNFVCQAHVRLSEGRIIRCQANEHDKRGDPAGVESDVLEKQSRLKSQERGNSLVTGRLSGR